MVIDYTIELGLISNVRDYAKFLSIKHRNQWIVLNVYYYYYRKTCLCCENAIYKVAINSPVYFDANKSTNVM